MLPDFQMKPTWSFNKARRILVAAVSVVADPQSCHSRIRWQKFKNCATQGVERDGQVKQSKLLLSETNVDQFLVRNVSPKSNDIN